MEVFDTITALQAYLQKFRTLNKNVGFVPTMGALHAGHISLINASRQECAITVCSIFINPTQFNDPKDLEKYPRTPGQDKQMLEQAGCDVLFTPAATEIYAENEQWHLEIGPLEDLLEGKFRPGHYQGVTQVVYKLFNIVKPDKAFFGQKDYQQYLVIGQMLKLLGQRVELVLCPIVREADGLAMSSRNVRLSAGERSHALILSKTLALIKADFDIHKLASLKQAAETMIKEEQGVELEYFEFADAEELQPATTDTKQVVALVAARVGPVRLIDNVILT